MQRLNSKLDTAEGRINKLEDKSEKIIQHMHQRERHRGKNMKMN